MFINKSIGKYLLFKDKFLNSNCYNFIDKFIKKYFCIVFKLKDAGGKMNNKILSRLAAFNETLHKIKYWLFVNYRLKLN